MSLNCLHRSSLLLACAALAGGCALPREVPVYRELSAGPAEQPFRDEAPRPPLLAALKLQIAALEQAGDLSRQENFGHRRVTRQRLLDTLREAKALFEADLSAEQLAEEMSRRFLFLKVGRTPRQERAFFTAYYTPLFPAWPKDDGSRNLYPVYELPAGLRHFPLAQLDPSLQEYELVYLLEGKELRPVPPRQKLYAAPWNKARPLGYLLDPLDRHLLEVQGSGVLLFPDGSRKNLTYAANNGYPFITVGRLLIGDGKMAPGQVSLPAIRGYFRQHPEELPGYMDRLRRAIFFRESKPGEPYPQGMAGEKSPGAAGLQLTAGRSLASDKTLFPAGALAYLCLPWPALPGDATAPALWQKQCRLALDQDHGGGITGPGRADLYVGEGSEAEEIAGHLSHYGEIYYLLKR